MFTENPKFIKILIVAAFAIIIPCSIIGINLFEKNVTNVRIWEDWTCDEMEKYALENTVKPTIEGELDNVETII